MGFYDVTPGSWFVRSTSDPRWNAVGRSVHVGDFMMPKECERQVAEFRAAYGEPPEDLTWGYDKD